MLQKGWDVTWGQGWSAWALRQSPERRGNRSRMTRGCADSGSAPEAFAVKRVVQGVGSLEVQPQPLARLCAAWSIPCNVGPAASRQTHISAHNTNPTHTPGGACAARGNGHMVRTRWTYAQSLAVATK